MLARTVLGSGLEIGPGDSPFAIGIGGATVSYVDQWSPEDNARIFPELKNSAFNKPDVIVNLNVERLSAFDDASQDFVIASHVFEHLVEPLGEMADAFRVLRPGGTLLIFLPDRRRTFDRDREPTTLEHLVEEYQRGVTELDDAHLIEFTSHVPEDWGDAPAPRDQAERFDRHRARSIHVHCWAEEEFLAVLLYMIENLGTPWELMDRLSVDDVPVGMEFGIALRRPTAAIPTALAAQRFSVIWASLTARGEQERALAARLAQLEVEAGSRTSQLAGVQQDLDRASAVIAAHERFLGPLRKWGVLAFARRVTGWIHRRKQ